MEAFGFVQKSQQITYNTVQGSLNTTNGVIGMTKMSRQEPIELNGLWPGS
jgi:hypothetical protein